jgi:hypothetical protein
MIDIGKGVSVGTAEGITVIVGAGSVFFPVVPHPTAKIDNIIIE